jgi:NAD binding domain of 6-phosphogluconate dehydrogenase
VNVGFIGLGRMGLPMARNLLRAGFPLTVYNRTTSRVTPLRDQGAAVAESPAEASRAADVVVTTLSDGAAVEEVTCGPAGVLERAREGAVVIEMSTIGPELARALGMAAGQRGVTLGLARKLGVVAPGVAAADRALTLARAMQGDDADLAAVCEALRAIDGGARRPEEVTS